MKGGKNTAVRGRKVDVSSHISKSGVEMGRLTVNSTLHTP